MNTPHMVASLFVLSCASATIVAGCGCDPGNNSQRAPITFAASSTDAVRNAAICGANPAFSTNDTFELSLLGDTTSMSPPYTLIKVDLTSNVLVNQSTPLLVSPAGEGEPDNTARSMDGSIKFTFANQSNGEIDTSALDSVVINILAMPSADGMPLSVEIAMTFDDGRSLDQVYSASLETPVVSCSK